MKKRFIPIAIVLAFLFWSGTGQTAFADSPEHGWRTFSRLDGIDATWVFDAAQTFDGAVWFATDRGVFRFDGEWVRANDGLSSDMALTLLVDEKGVLWVGTASGLARWRDDAWDIQGRGTELETEWINDMVTLPGDAILAGGESGLYIWALQDGWRRLADAPLSGAEHLAVDAFQRVWTAKGDQLFLHSNAGWKEVSLFQSGLSDEFAISDLAPDASGGMWVATSHRGVAHITGGESVWETVAGGLPDDHVLAMSLTPNGELWVGTSAGAGKLSSHGWSVYGVENGLLSDVVSSVFQDKDGVVWFGSPSGITRYDAHTWRDWSDAPGAPHGRISAMAIGPDGVLWAGVMGDGLYRLKNDDWRKVDLVMNGASLSPSFIVTLFVDDAGGVWISSRDNGVIYFDDQFVRQLIEPDGSAAHVVTSIAQTPDGLLWFGTTSAGLKQWDRRNWRTFTQRDGLLSDHITALLVGDDGALLVGADAGVSRFDGKVWQTIVFPRELSHSEITSLAQGENGAVWVGFHGKGLGYWQDGEWKSFSVGSGLLSAEVNALMFRSGRLWVGSPAGLAAYDGLSWQYYSPAFGYDIGQVYALAGGESGPIYLGEDAGVIRYSPHATSPLLQIVSVNGQRPKNGVAEVMTGEEVRISFRGKHSLATPDELIYMYRLDGVDSAWRSERESTVVYPSLQNGEYAFHALARDADLNYSQPVTMTLRVTSHKPFILLPKTSDRMCSWLAMLSILLLGLFLAVVGYALWSTIVRWHMRNQAVERRFNPYIAGVPVRSPDLFFGRDELLQNAEAGLAYNSLMIYGERRIGKTSLLYRLLDDLRRLKDDKFQFFPVFVDLEGTLEPEFFHHLMEGLLDALHDELSDFPLHKKLQYFLVSDDVGYTDRHMRRDLRQIVSYLKKRHEKTPRIIFLLDEADVLSTYSSLTQQQLRRIMQDVFAQNIGVVIAGVNISKAWDRVESPWYNMFIEVVVPPLNRYESELLMREPVYGFYEWEEAAIRFIWRRTQGRPHRIQKIAREAVNVMLDDHRQTITLTDVRRAYERVVFAESR